jgi:hypothetical protein
MSQKMAAGGIMQHQNGDSGNDEVDQNVLK